MLLILKLFYMNKNVGILDRIIRFLAAIVLVDLAIGHNLTGFWGTIAWILAIVLAMTAMVSICPLYEKIILKAVAKLSYLSRWLGIPAIHHCSQWH
jgi:hypothetical protein